MSEAVVKAVEAPGWFGKLPALGDFASRRLPSAFVRGWDDWLQSGLGAARDAQGAAWLDGYLVAPIRRFWLGPGVLGSRAWAGLLMPSVDGVGRHFPLTIAAPLARSTRGLDAALAASEWFGAIEQVARRVLDVHFSVDDFERDLAGVAAITADPAADDETTRLAHTLVAPFAQPPSRAGAPACSVWWCDDAVREPSQFMCFASLPPAAALAALLAAPA